MSTKQDRQEEARDIKSGDDQPSNMSEVYLPFIGFFIVMAVGLGLVIGGFNALEYHYSLNQCAHPLPFSGSGFLACPAAMLNS